MHLHTASRQAAFVGEKNNRGNGAGEIRDEVKGFGLVET